MDSTTFLTPLSSQEKEMAFETGTILPSLFDLIVMEYLREHESLEKQIEYRTLYFYLKESFCMDMISSSYAEPFMDFGMVFKINESLKKYNEFTKDWFLDIKQKSDYSLSTAHFRNNKLHIFNSTVYTSLYFYIFLAKHDFNYDCYFEWCDCLRW